MSEQPNQPDLDADDPDRDPDNLAPRDDRPSQHTDEGYADPDADPENLNPREG
jgi:hypothetical protein